MIKKPMLASAIQDINTLIFPLIASPKLDGIRCLKVDGKVVSRSFKPIRNDYIRGILEEILPEGADGEIMSISGDFQVTTGAVMRSTGEPEFCYYMFDLVGDDPNEPYINRLAKMATWFTKTSHNIPVKLVPIELINDIEELMVYETECLNNGYEGVMTRTLDGPYKFGRATPKQQWLLKLKRFIDAEAEIIGYEEAMHNVNEAKKDAFGRTKRSSAKDGKIAAGRLGSLIVRDIKTNIEFGLGTGFDMEQREEFWIKKEDLIGKIVKYKSQPTGVKEAPRFPVFLGFRSLDDMS